MEKLTLLYDNSFPIFFNIKERENDKIRIQLKQFRFIKYADYSAEFVPDYNLDLCEIEIQTAALIKAERYDESKKYKNEYYHHCRQLINDFYAKNVRN